MRIGVLTGGGDCPGLNAVIRAIVRKGVGEYGHEFLGYRNGWAGPLERLSAPLGVPEVRGILPRGGTILGSSRTNPLKEEGGVERVTENLAGAGVDGLIAIGGEDTLGVAAKLHEQGVKVVGVPKTIDNDRGATVILIPELPFDIEKVCNYIERRFESQYSPIIVVAEGAAPQGGIPEADSAPVDAFGHVRLGGIAHWLEGE